MAKKKVTITAKKPTKATRKKVEAAIKAHADKDDVMKAIMTSDSLAEVIEKLKHDHLGENEKRKFAKSVLEQICPKLFLAGVYSIHVSYNGEGDNGDIDHVCALDANGCYMTWPKSVEVLMPAIRQAVWEFIPGGFEINDGSYGEITITIPTRKIAHEHNEREVMINTTNASDEF